MSGGKVRTLTREWDRVLTYSLFILFGVYSSLFYSIVSVEKVATHGLEILLGVNFVVAGLAMMYGLFADRYDVWRMGAVVAFIGLMTITGLITVVGGVKVYSYAILFGALACQSLYGVRREKEEKKRKGEAEIRRQLEEIIHSVKPGSPQ